MLFEGHHCSGRLLEESLTLKLETQSASTILGPELGAPELGPPEVAGTRPASVIKDFAALAKPRLSSLVLVTTAGGLWLAPGELGTVSAAGTVVATAGVVAAANALNCYLERDSDRLMARTKDRPLPTGRLDAKVAAIFGACTVVISLLVLLLASNALAAAIAAGAFVSYVWIYTPLKKRSPLAVLVGTIPGAAPPVIGWAAVTGSLGMPALVLFGILVFWQIHHFLAIAINQQDEYAKAGIKTFPRAYGMAATRWTMLLSTLALFGASVAAVSVGLGSWIYLAAALPLGAIAIWKAAQGFRAEDQSAWAYDLFKFTLSHLGLLFIALVVDGVVMLFL